MNKQEPKKYFDTDGLKSGLKRRAVKGASATFMYQTSNYLIHMVSTIILARILTPNDFGLVAMVSSFFLFFKMFRNFGLMDATIQKDEINQELISTIFWINVAIGFLLTFLFMAMAPLIAWFYSEPALTLIAMIFSLDFIFGGISTQHRALLKRNLQFYQWAANEIVATIVSFVSAIFMALKGYGYWALVARPLLFGVAQTVGSWIVCRWRPGFPVKKTGVRSMMKFGMNMLFNHTLNYISQNVDKILIGKFNGTQALGYYHKAYHLFMAPAQQMAYPLTGVAVATLSRLRDDSEKFRRYFLKAISLLSFIGMPTSAILVMNGNDIILLLLGPQWEPAGKIFAVFGLGVGIQILYATHSWLHISLGRPDRWFKWNVAGSVITIIAFCIGLPFGPIGVATAYTTVLYILVGPSLWYAGRPVNLKFLTIFSEIWRYFLAAYAAGLISGFVINRIEILNIYINIITSITFISIIYILLIIILYQSTQPLRQIISTIQELTPGILKKSTR